jgi:hypothetical protein
MAQQWRKELAQWRKLEIRGSYRSGLWAQCWGQQEPKGQQGGVARMKRRGQPAEIPLARISYNVMLYDIGAYSSGTHLAKPL